jgi:hypothetical protein
MTSHLPSKISYAEERLYIYLPEFDLAFTRSIYVTYCLLVALCCDSVVTDINKRLFPFFFLWNKITAVVQIPKAEVEWSKCKHFMWIKLWSLVTRLRMDDRGSIPGRSREFLSSPPCPDRLWGPPSLLSSGYLTLSLGGEAPWAWSWSLTFS